MEDEDIAPNTYLHLIQSVWAESRATTHTAIQGLNAIDKSRAVFIGSRLDELYVFGAVFSAAFLCPYPVAK